MTWAESTDAAPPEHYFYGNSVTVHPTDDSEVAVGGSGYSGPGVIRSTDGGRTWSAEADGLPQTLVYSLVYAEDGSGDLYAGTETGAYRWSRLTGLWENIMGTAAPTTIYWSAEVVNDGGTIRYGTYGRGAWDYSIVADDRDGDGVGDDSDLCPNNDDPLQADLDGDGLGDPCDNCASLANPMQGDSDADDAGNFCDCAPTDAGVIAIPGEVEGLRWLSNGILEWASAIPTAGSATDHIVYRGDLGDYPVAAANPCSATRLSAARLTSPEIPAPGAGYWYVIQALNSCGSGGLGSWGDGTPRDAPSCP